MSDPGTVFLRSSFFSYAEYSGSNSLYFFEDTGESNEDIEVGLVTFDEREAPSPPRRSPARKKPSGKKRRA